MPLKDATVAAAYMRKWRERARATGMCDACHSSPATIAKKCERCHERALGYRRAIKREALDHYGGRCVCCGEGNDAFLSFDHINNDGAQMRRSIPSTNGGVGLHYWLRRNGYPDIFQVMCFNCNYAKHHLGACPHQSTEE
mgnify:CR=1 FL=1